MSLINKAFIISANMIGYALYIKTKKIKGASYIRKVAGFCILLNIVHIMICAFLVARDRSFIKPWGYKFDKEIVLYCFNNPNSEALFLFLCMLSVWVFIKNKLFRIIIISILTYINFRLTYGRTYFVASVGLILIDVLMKKNRLKYFSYMLIFIPIVVSLASICIGLITRNNTFIFFDSGLLGRFLMYGRALKMMNFSNIIFGISESMDFPMDGSFFVIFVSMGFFMFMYLLIQYIKYIKNIDSQYSNFIPAIFCLVLAGVTESALALFSINSVLLITLLVCMRKVSIECHNDRRPRI
jgi:hypothetical protein